MKDVAKYAGRTFLQTGLHHLNRGAKRVIDKMSDDNYAPPTKKARPTKQRAVRGPKQTVHKKPRKKQPKVIRRKTTEQITPKKRDVFSRLK